MSDNQDEFNFRFWLDQYDGTVDSTDYTEDNFSDEDVSESSDSPTGGASNSRSSDGLNSSPQPVQYTDDEKDMQKSENLISTIADAKRMLQELFERQIEKALEVSTVPNTSIRGDAEARIGFYTLLPLNHQRQFFLKIASSQRSWPRIRSLFGAPPYSFLLPQDESMLNATGIARSRSHMAYEDSKIANYSQFGVGQFTDEYEREYRVFTTSLSDEDQLPSNISTSDNEKLQLIVRVQKRSNSERMRRIKDKSLRKTITFPVIGERLVLQETKRLISLQNRKMDTSKKHTFRVMQVKPRDMNASTASVLVIKS